MKCIQTASYIIYYGGVCLKLAGYQRRVSTEKYTQHVDSFNVKRSILFLKSI